MGQIDFRTYRQNLQNNVSENGVARTNSNARPLVSYFSLKNDKDQATVRILVDSLDDLEIIGLHRVKMGNRTRSVSCMREPTDPVANCPFCDAGNALNYRVFIPLLEYTKDDQGNTIAIPRVWERAASYINTLSDLIDNYGPLSDNIFKIVRNGVAGSRDTTYNIMYGAPSVYKPELYPKDTSAFVDYKALGNAVLEVTAAEAVDILNGNVPERFQPRVSNTNNSAAAAPGTVAPAASASVQYQDTSYQAAAPTRYANNSYAAPAAPEPRPVTPRPNPVVGNNEAAAVRPRRYYS